MPIQDTAPTNVSSESPTETKTAPETANASATAFERGPRFWTILVALALTGLLTAVEATISSTILPEIVSELHGGENYIWVANAYFLTMASLQPMFGQLANVFGRRWPMILSTVAFMIGSGICGGANSIGMLIAGRTVQGVGASGLSVLVETVVCDLVPLRERGTYVAAVFGMVSVGTALGPLFGGLLVTDSTWRWAFYLSLPIGGVVLVMLTLFLHVQHDRSTSMATKLGSLDWLGNAVFVGASCAVLIALSWAGGTYEWSSRQVLVPLLVGLVGLGAFVVLEATAPCIANPMMPLHLFSNSISALVFLLTFLHGLVTIWAFYFLPVYFQGVIAATPYRSGLMLLPTILALVPGAILGGLALTKLGRYKPILMLALALIVIGFGLLSLLDEHSTTGAWVGYQIIESFGAGMAVPSLLPALLAPLSDRDTALATGTWAFMRTFGLTWGVAIAGTVFSNRAAQLARAGKISSSPQVAAGFAAGKAYEYATADFLNTLSAETRAEAESVQNMALKLSWQVAIAFGAVGLIASVLLKEIPLRSELDTEFGMTDKEKSGNDSGEKGEAKDKPAA